METESPQETASPQLVDSHAHLDMPDFAPDLPQVIQRARDAGLSHIICVGTDESAWSRCLELAGDYPMIYAALGIHPHEAVQVNDRSLTQLAEHSHSPKVVAVGEIGLDYHYMHSPAPVQQQAFEQQLDLADELGLPVIIHQREAAGDALAILQSQPPRKGGVMHCFSGDEAVLGKCLELGLYISVAGPVTFKNANRLSQIAAKIPDDRLLVETDCPYLTPVPHRGQRNEPAYVSYVARRVAEIRGLSVEDIARITSLNAHHLFGIPSGDDSPKIVYPIRNTLYINLTNRCTNNCTFCARQNSYYVKGHNLKLEHEPNADDVLAEIQRYSARDYPEIVFCGYGEPMLRLDAILALAPQLKVLGYKIRINTNGQGLLIRRDNFLPQFAGLIDALSVSLNTPETAQYANLCRPQYGPAAYKAIQDFILAAKPYVPEIVVTSLDLPEVDTSACRRIAELELGVKYRQRIYSQVG